ncbi:Crp/Fnr family transcriptional regulator [Lacrimispora sp. 210928-DFI.3.58]|uniref:Crp/Fnr family transcriptional regulator n=1 Tax=Lacrimispora sp. 210928-DFI.3.58 TaxID=2883214 RepID=UPI0015B6844E|nr:Crp/Fnr family transcriptional regulator [Lacrimispora sp. 210928-DFI.3.58]MCB7318320.1 Crp/Fnr family transcriptional regulator [Lacrimispora sp. 210928-DFI.3.58]
MTLSELEAQYPALLPYTKNMPEDIRRRCTVRTHPAGSIIHQKDMELHYFGIVATGENRVINEFENGNVYMIETNKPIDFIGEVTILAQMPRTSVTIEAVTETIAAYISRKDAERWLSQDAQILRLVSRHVAFKLYRSSYSNGAKLFYPPSYLLLDYLVQHGRAEGMESAHPPKSLTIGQTRQHLQEAIGVNVKTLNRTIRHLKDEGFFSLCKGKITYDRTQYLKALEWLRLAKDK